MKNPFKKDREKTIEDQSIFIVSSIIRSSHQFNQEEQNDILKRVVSTLKHEKELRKAIIENEAEHIEILMRNFAFSA